MSDTPIFDQLFRERGIRRSMSPEGIARVFGTTRVSKAPDEYLDGPSHMIGAQKFDDVELTASPLVTEGLVAGLKDTPFDPEKTSFYSVEVSRHHTVSDTLKSSLGVKLARGGRHGTVVWSEMTDKEREEEISEAFDKQVSDARQSILNTMGMEMDQGGIITRVEPVVDGAVPNYKPLFEREDAEE